MSLLPENYDSSDFEKTSSSPQFFGLEDDGDSNTIRILGDAEQPATFVMGYQSWPKGKEKKSFRYSDKDYKEAIAYLDGELNDKGNPVMPAKIWVTQIYNVTLGCAQVWEIKQKKVREELENFLANPKWGDLSYYDITVTRNGVKGDNKTSYSLIGDPEQAYKKELPSEQIIKAMKEARIDCRVIFDGDYPLGALEIEEIATNDQSNIERIKSKLNG